MEIKIPFKTPTINHLYWHKGNMKILTKEARDLREEIKDIIQGVIIENDKRVFDIIGDKKLKVEIEIHENWLTKKGDIKKKDISNREKFLIDSVFKALDIDDKFIFEHIMKKIQDEKEMAIITIGELK